MALKLKIQFFRTVKLYLRSSGRNLMGDPSQLIVRTSLYFAKSEKWEQENESMGLARPDMLAHCDAVN